MFDDCIHVVFCRPLGLVSGFNAILMLVWLEFPMAVLKYIQ